MARKFRYQCSACGHIETGWSGKCPACGEWGTMEEMPPEEAAPRRTSKGVTAKKAVSLPNVPLSEAERIDTGTEELNRVLGGGLVPDSVTMLTAKPGAGKSTLLLQVAGRLASRGIRVLYASGEESASQIRMRASRVLQTLPEEIYLMATNSLDEVLLECERLRPAVFMVDSIQTMSLGAFSQRPGTPTQTVECTAAIVEACKNPTASMAAFVIGHVTKEDTMAGLRTLEHQVDTVLFLESGLSESLRILRSTKNRFGFTNEVGLFQMTADGLQDVGDPYELFLTRRLHPVSGAAIALQREGSRFIPIEMEALVSTAYEAYPTRIGDSLRRDTLNTLVSILEKRAGFRMGDQSVVLKATGGLAVREKVCDLAILVAIASAAEGWTVSEKDAFCAEVGLTGELKRVNEMEQRLKELERLGFHRAFVAKDYQALASKWSQQSGMAVYCVKTLPEVLFLLREEK